MSCLWGTAWGIHDPAHPEFAGHFWFPYSHMTARGVASDFWVVRDVMGESPAA